MQIEVTFLPQSEWQKSTEQPTTNVQSAWAALIHCVVGLQTGVATIENCMESSQEAKNLPHDPATSRLGTRPKDLTPYSLDTLSHDHCWCLHNG